MMQVHLGRSQIGMLLGLCWEVSGELCLHGSIEGIELGLGDQARKGRASLLGWI
jgi:hypothetical protein